MSQHAQDITDVSLHGVTPGVLLSAVSVPEDGTTDHMTTRANRKEPEMAPRKDQQDQQEQTTTEANEAQERTEAVAEVTDVTDAVQVEGETPEAVESAPAEPTPEEIAAMEAAKAAEQRITNILLRARTVKRSPVGIMDDDQVTPAQLVRYELALRNEISPIKELLDETDDGLLFAGIKRNPQFSREFSDKVKAALADTTDEVGGPIVHAQSHIWVKGIVAAYLAIRMVDEGLEPVALVVESTEPVAPAEQAEQEATEVSA